MLSDSDLECQPAGKVKMQLRNNTRKLGILFAACVLAGGLVSAQDQDFSKVQLKVAKVAGNIYMPEGGGAGNIGASVGDDGIFIVDDQYAPLPEKIQAVLKGITDKPVRSSSIRTFTAIAPAATHIFKSKRPSLRKTTFANVWRAVEASATAAQYIWTLSRRLTMPCPSSLSIMMLPCTSTEKVSALSTSLPDILTATPSFSFPTQTWCTWATILSPAASHSSTWRATAASMA
jgi:hypothetical protein